MVADDLAIVCDIHHIKRMEAVLVVHIHATVNIFQHKNHAGRRVVLRRNYCVEPEGGLVQTAVMLDIVSGRLSSRHRGCPWLGKAYYNYSID